MKVLLDTCVWGGAAAALAEAGHDVVWAGEWPEDPGDSAILARAVEEGRILVTLDKTFGELAVVRGGSALRHSAARWLPRKGARIGVSPHSGLAWC